MKIRNGSKGFMKPPEIIATLKKLSADESALERMFGPEAYGLIKRNLGISWVNEPVVSVGTGSPKSGGSRRPPSSDERPSKRARA